MSARLRFAISTASFPDILLIDEALATGDVDFRQRSRQRVEEIIDEAGTVLLVSHSMSTVREMCDRVIWINKGLIERDGPTDEVLDEYARRTGIPTARNSRKKKEEAAAAAKAAAEAPAAESSSESPSEASAAGQVEADPASTQPAR